MTIHTVMGQGIIKSPCNLLNNLIAFWKLSDGTDAYDGNHLTNQGAMPYAAGKIDNATSQDGTAKFLYINDNAALSMGNYDFTISAWVKVADKTATRPIVTKYDWNGNNREYLLDYITGTDRFRFQVSDDGTSVAGHVGFVLANTLGSPAVGTWYFVLAEHRATTDVLAISINNNVADTAVWATGVADKASAFQIGALSYSAQYMQGQVDAVGVWKRLLSSTEKACLWNGGLGREYPFRG